jgi:hypothetical protein
MEMNNFDVAEYDVICNEFCEATIVDNSRCQGDIPTCSTMIMRIAKTSNVHRTNLQCHCLPMAARIPGQNYSPAQ